MDDPETPCVDDREVGGAAEKEGRQVEKGNGGGAPP
jgi:hypothetical protein